MDELFYHVTGEEDMGHISISIAVGREDVDKGKILYSNIIHILESDVIPQLKWMSDRVRL